MIYRHPLGRFEVVETMGRNMFGDTYRIREAVLTPERDARGLLHEEDLIDAGWHNYKSREPLSDEDKARICRMYQGGAKMQHIATSMGRSVETVRKVLLAAGLCEPYKQRWTDEERRTVVRMYLQGANYDAICEAVGRTRKAVAQALTVLRKQQVI